MDIDVLRGQLEREIASADEAIRSGEAQIEALKEENADAAARIEHAREALAVLDQLLEKLEVLGPLAVDVARGDRAGKRVPQKKIVDPIVAGAERSGIAFEEIIAQAKRSHGVDLKPASLKSFLSRMKVEGIYEQREDGNWRPSALPSSRAAAE
jgi:septal ring factor EnvC (AmiA/AmiB activator)